MERRENNGCVIQGAINNGFTMGSGSELDDSLMRNMINIPRARTSVAKSVDLNGADDMSSTELSYHPHRNFYSTNSSIHRNIMSLNGQNIKMDYQNQGHGSRNAAVVVESGSKSFGKTKVLENINLTVAEGSIYGLLGSSGCGKTTLLSCIVGLRKLDNGDIYICGKRPGEKGSGVPGRLLGYMPQDVALNGEFTMKEVCHYFGRLYGMDRDKVDDRIHYLTNLLDLRRCKGQIKNFSGGQKRRASFAVALLHEADILILDEPTVGVDPVLRSSIWSHLRELVDKCSVTVIITTHYIEEMRQADCIGIMRNGVVMVEDSPTNLLETHNATMLEDVVLKYCLRIDENEEFGSKITKGRAQNYQSKNSSHMELSRSYSQSPISQNYQSNYNNKDLNNTTFYNRINAMTLKNILVMARNIGFLFFIFVMPAMIVAVFCFSVGSDPSDLGLGVINEDYSDCKNDTPLTCSPTQLSCAYLNILNTGDFFSLKKYSTIKKALEDVDERKVWGYVRMGQNFSQYMFERTIRNKLDNETYFGSRINVRLDMSTPSLGEGIKKGVYDAFRAFSAALLTVCNIDITGRDLPVNFEEPIYGKEGAEMTEFISPGIAVGFLSFMASLTCGLSYIIEKKDGMLSRSIVAGVKTWEIMMSHFIPQLGVVLVQTAIAFVIMFYGFEIPKLGNIFLAFTLIILTAIAGMCLGFIASAVFDEEKNAMLLAIGVMMPSFLLSGLIWPVEGLPKAFRDFSYALPNTLSSESFRSIILRGWDLSYTPVWLGFLTTFGWIGLYILTTAILVRFKK